MVSQICSSQIRNQIHIRTAEIRGRKIQCSVSKHDRDMARGRNSGVNERDEYTGTIKDCLLRHGFSEIRRKDIDDIERLQQRMDRDTENYEKKCERLRANGAKGGRPSKTEEEKPNGFSENQMVSDENQENQIDVVPDPDPVPDPDKDKRQTHRDRAQTRKADPIDYQSIFDAYNSICTSMPPVETFSESRKKAIRSMLRTRSPDEVKQLFARAQASPFLTGTNDTGWRASFDWIMNQSNAAKILEGNYDRMKIGYNASWAARRKVKSVTTEKGAITMADEK